MRAYERYLKDYALAHSPEMKDLITLEEVETAYDEDTNPVYKEGYILRDNLQLKYVAPKLAKNPARDKVASFVSQFMDAHADQLMTAGPTYSFVLGQKEIQPIYDIFDVNGEMLIDLYNQVVQETYFGNISKIFTGWVTRAPHKLLLTAIIIEGLQHEYAEMVEAAEYLYVLTEYPILYREYWKTSVNPEVMNYTIEHLGKKYKIKQLKNLQQLLKYDADQSVNFYTKQLLIGADNTYLDLLYRIRNQMNAKFRNIAREYYKNVEQNRTLHTNQNDYDDGEMPDQEGQISVAAQIIDRTASKVTYSEVNSALIRITADRNQVDKSNLSGMIGQVNATKNNKLPQFVEKVITIYFNKNPGTTTMREGGFLNFGLSLYRSISMSKDPMLKELAKYLNFWMEDIIKIHDLYDREQTVISYRKAVWDYYILLINYYQDS